MVNLQKCPRLERLAEKLAELEDTFGDLSDLYKGRKRISGRSVMEHCLETAEIVSHYTFDTVYIKGALFHDIYEDLHLSFKDIKKISIKNGDKIAAIVATLSKDPEIKERALRNKEYMTRLLRAIFNEDPALGLIKIADRRSNLTDIQYLPPKKRTFIADQTINFYVPIAVKLGFKELAKVLGELSLPYVSNALYSLICTENNIIFPTISKHQCNWLGVEHYTKESQKERR